MRRLVRWLISPLARFCAGGWETSFFIERDHREIWIGYTDQFGATHQTDITPAEAKLLARKLLRLAGRAERGDPKPE